VAAAWHAHPTLSLVASWHRPRRLCVGRRLAVERVWWRLPH